MASWSEIEVAQKESRHELVLSGAEVSSRIEKKGLDPYVFCLTSLNFLEISQTCLTEMPTDLGKMSHMTNLVLRGNKLKTLPSSLGNLGSLKMLDLSRNELESLPQELSNLAKLESLNLGGNLLAELTDLSGLTTLHILDISHNQFEALPEGVASLQLLAQVLANGNKLKELPGELSEMASLKTLDVSDNQLEAVPSEMHLCPKLKEFKCTGNKLKDKRLGKMMQQCSTKAVLDYLRTVYQKDSSKGKGKDKKSKKKKKGKSDADEIEDLTQNMMNVLHFHEETGVTVYVKPDVARVRPYFVGCIVRNLNLMKTHNMFKRFIALQTKLHDGICSKRVAATIATHDLARINGPLAYTAKKPQEMKLTPLFKMRETTAQKLVGKLRQEAEELRKEKKRNTYSGIHKYLNLLDGQPLYPCLVDKDDVVVSFPPITNCDVSKVTKNTTNIFVEVTSSTSLDTCKKVMDQLLQSLLEMGIGGAPETRPSEASATSEDSVEDDDATPGEEDYEGYVPLIQDQKLDLEQVKVVDFDSGGLKVLYPSRTDLASQYFRIIRET